MKPPPWLQELRDLLAITSYEGRQDALVHWEQRWLVELHHRKILTNEEMAYSRANPIEITAQHIRYKLGMMLAEVMVATSVHQGYDADIWGRSMTAIRGDVIAIRREPKTDD